MHPVIMQNGWPKHAVAEYANAQARQNNYTPKNLKTYIQNILQHFNSGVQRGPPPHAGEENVVECSEWEFLGF